MPNNVPLYRNFSDSFEYTVEEVPMSNGELVSITYIVDFDYSCEDSDGVTPGSSNVNVQNVSVESIFGEHGEYVIKPDHTSINHKQVTKDLGGMLGQDYGEALPDDDEFESDQDIRLRDAMNHFYKHEMYKVEEEIQDYARRAGYV
jgi:hypothetical protein